MSRIEKAHYILSGAKHNEKARNIMTFSHQFTKPAKNEPGYMLLARRKALRSVLEEAVEVIWHTDFNDYDPATRTSKLYLEALSHVFYE